MAWICSRCGVEMEEVRDIRIILHDLKLPDGNGLRCPKCGVEFLQEDYVTGELNDSELFLEGK